MSAVDAIAADEAVRRLIVADGLDAGLFVEAGAGTGKTTQLVGRVVALVKDRGIPLPEIAAITFTEAAATELRDRIREELERAASGTAEPVVRERCVRALADVDVAAISTLHAFAQRILTEHPVEVGIPPRVEVLDEVHSQLAFERRWEEFVDRMLAEPTLEPVLERALALGVRISHRRLTSLRSVAVVFGENWDRLAWIAQQSRAPLPLPRADAVVAIAELLRLEASCADPDDKLARWLHDHRGEMETIAFALEHLDDTTLLRTLRSLGSWKVGNVGQAGAWDGDAKAARAVVTGARAVLDALVADATDAVLRVLAAELARFTVSAAEERRREGALEFHDLLVLARRLLRTSPSARRALHDRYRRLLLDEFQDTDPIQIELAVLIASTVDGDVDQPWHEVVTEEERLFFVGDPKQSIYRFRRADIALFLEARNRFAATVPYSLTRNFRTVPTVLGWVNHVFGRLMAEEVPEAQPRYEPLSAARVEPDGADHRVVLLGGPLEAAPGERLTAADVRQAEAEQVADAVAWIGRAPERWPVADGAGGWRPPQWADVAILVPTRTSLAALLRELERRGVPYRAETGSLVYETQEVRDLLAIVRCIVDPTDAIALVAALRAPVFGCGDDDLATYRAANGRWDLRTPAPPGLDGAHPVVAALAVLRHWWEDRWWLDASALVERIIREGRCFELAFAHRRPRDVWRRLRFVSDQARMFTEAQGGDLVEYLAWAELQRHESARVHEPLLPETDDDAVRIMTVHGAKGREFPITVVSGLTTEQRNGARGIGVAWDEAGRVEVKLSGTLRTSRFDACNELEAEMDAHEKARLLYVAVTRARDHLLVSTTHKAGKRCFAATLWEESQAELDRTCRVGEQHPPPVGTLLPDEAGSGATTDADDTVAARAAWVEARAVLLAGQARSRSLSPTGLARADAPDDPELGTAADDLAGETDALEETFARRRGRAGTAIGRAVHAVLQSVDLATGDGLEELAEAHAHLEGVPDRVGTVGDLARRALAAPVVRAAAAGEHWREVYVAAPGGRGVLEGYVDLLVRTDDGLVVVDYKTDRVRDEREVDERVDRYRLQGAGYAVALEAATGVAVYECRFVFTATDPAIERTLDDLDEAKAQVRRALAAQGTSQA